MVNQKQKKESRVHTTCFEGLHITTKAAGKNDVCVKDEKKTVKFH